MKTFYMVIGKDKKTANPVLAQLDEACLDNKSQFVNPSRGKRWVFCSRVNFDSESDELTDSLIHLLIHKVAVCRGAN